MDPLARDVLAQRLHALEVPEPDADRVAARARARLARGSSARRLAVAAVAGLLFTFVLVPYFAPAIGVALADAPPVGALLKLVGLSSPVTLGDRASAAGIEVELRAGYADEARTVLLITMPAQLGVRVSQVALRDQFGQEYVVRSGIADTATGEGVLTFEPLRGAAAILGSRLTLTIAAVDREASGAGAQQVIRAPWVLHGTLVAGRGQPIEGVKLPNVGAAHLEVTRARALPDSLLLQVRVSGVSAADLTRLVPGPRKPHSALSVELVDRLNATHDPLTLEFASDADSTILTALWIVPSGEYDLVFALEGVGEARTHVGKP